MTRVLASSALVLGSWVPLLPGQTYRAGIRGVVQDSGGGASRSRCNDDSTGFNRVSVTNEVGPSSKGESSFPSRGFSSRSGKGDERASF
jgi:hypothetical protein